MTYYRVVWLVCSKYVCRFVISWLIVGFPIMSFAQSDTLSVQQFINGVALYRSHFNNDIKDAFQDLAYLSDSLKQFSLNPEAHDLFIKRFLDHFSKGEAYYIQDAIDAAIPESIREEKDAQMLYRQWGSKHQLEIVQMHFLVSNKIIRQADPFPLTSNTDIWDEIHFYGLREGQTMVEVGAGIGEISFLLIYSGIGLQFYMTELNTYCLTKLSEQLNKSMIDLSDRSIQIVMAKEKSLGLPEHLQADCILMRDVYHHLDYPYQVLGSVREHLSADGTLILVESVKDLKANKKEGCRQALSLKKVKYEVTKNGYALTGQKRVADRYVLKFQKTKN